ncbi:MAG: hypothetical protein H6729_01100 [Deltaproteobacteria bacterium]|nr:hypothetical protein [Deltaproteobacteria bacterium]
MASSARSSISAGPVTFRATTAFGAVAVAVAIALGAPAAVRAAESTHVLTAVEKTRPLPELGLSVSFDRATRAADITREWIQNAGTDSAFAADVRELRYKETVQRLLIGLRVGLFRDLEFHVTLPIVLQSDTKITFAKDVEATSTIIGSANADAGCDVAACPAELEYRYPITNVPAQRNRSGFGDMTLGLAWSPVVDDKDESYPTITFRGDIIVPTGATRRPDDPAALPGGGDGGIGLGQTTFDLSLGVSRRLRTKVPTFDPYVLLGVKLPVATGSQKARGYEPPVSGRFVVGTEVVFYEEEASSSLYGLDLAVGAEYVGVGRTYSELSDYLPNFDQTSLVDENGDGREPAQYADFANPSNYVSQRDGATCGLLSGVSCGELNRVDDHLNLTGSLALRFEPTRFTRLKIGVAVELSTNHLLTTEPVGKDTDPASASTAQCEGAACVGRVNPKNSQGDDERSAYYDPRYDAPGRRFRIEDALTFTFFATGAATF